MLAPIVPAACPFVVLYALVCLAGPAAAQSTGIPHPAAVKGFDPQPDPPGKLRTPMEQLARGGIGKGALGSDVTSKKGITIGNTFATWGTPVTIPDGQAYNMERGKCAFRISYDMVNQGPVATLLVFKNTLTAGPAIVSTDDSLLLNGLQAKQVNTHAWLSPGTYDLILRLDAGNTVPETNELNNVMRVRVTLDGRRMCRWWRPARRTRSIRHHCPTPGRRIARCRRTPSRPPMRPPIRARTPSRATGGSSSTTAARLPSAWARQPPLSSFGPRAGW
jgi:hypothetical protein